MLSILLSGCGDPNQAANRLFVEASQLLKESKEAGDDLDRAYPAARDAMAKLAQIVKSYPESEMAVKLVQGQAVINGKPFDWNDRKWFAAIERDYRIEKQVGSSPKYLLLAVNQKLTGQAREMHSVELARLLAAAGDRKDAEVLLAEIEQMEFEEPWRKYLTLRQGVTAWAEIDPARAEKMFRELLGEIDELDEGMQTVAMSWLTEMLPGLKNKLEVDGLFAAVLEQGKRLRPEVVRNLRANVAWRMAQAGAAGTRELVDSLLAAAEHSAKEGELNGLPPLALALTKLGDRERAVAFLTTARDSIAKMDSDKQAMAKRNLVESFAAIGDLDAAFAVAASLEGPEQAQALGSCIYPVGSAGDWGGVRKLFERILEIAGTLEQHEMVPTFHIMDWSLPVRNSEDPGIKRVLVKALSLAESRLDSQLSGVRTAIAMGMVKNGAIPDALKLAAKLESDERSQIWNLASLLTCTKRIEDSSHQWGFRIELRDSFDSTDANVKKALVTIAREKFAAPPEVAVEAQKNACIANLKQIDGAVQQWALEKRKIATDSYELKSSGILDYLKGSRLPICPSGETYSPGANVSGVPRCSMAAHGHTL